MEKSIKKLKIDWILAALTILTMIAILSYFLISYLTGNKTVNQPFLYTAIYILRISAYLYIGVFLIKVTLFLLDKTNVNVKTTPLVFDLIIILLSLLFPLILS